MKQINDDLYRKLEELGIIDDSNVRSSNAGDSDYSHFLLQPWAIWIDHDLDPWDADIVKRVLRRKKSDPRILDYIKIKHICDEKIRQIETQEKYEAY